MKQPQSAMEKLVAMSRGECVVVSDEQLDQLCVFDLSNLVRTKPNPNQVGTKDRWEAWIEQKVHQWYSKHAQDLFDEWQEKKESTETT